MTGKKRSRRIPLEKIWMKWRIYVKKITEIFFQDALRKEQG